MSWILFYTTLGWLIRFAMVPVVLRRQLAPGASMAWLGIVSLHPYIGLSLYLLVGETRLGPRRVARHRELVRHFRGERWGGTSQNESATAPNLDESYQPMVLQALKIGSLPVVSGNCIEFMTESAQLVDRLVADIDAAAQTVHLLYYIFVADATGERVVGAVERAAARGVCCRVMADAVASRRFFRRAGLGPRLTRAGVHVVDALPVAPISRGLPRMDLRNHRKLAVIDGRIAFIGSHNLVNPDYGGQRCAPWVDLTGRVTGPVVNELGVVFAEDWAFETDEILEVPVAQDMEPGNIHMQVVPTGPSAPGDTFRRVLLGAAQCARERLILTTPYFVPDEPTLVALMMAADRGVEVSLILPEKPDHFFTASAGRAHFSTLLNAGVGIFLYKPGLIHSKTVTVDDAFGIFGSANLDVRSFNLNFELSVVVYGSEVTARMRTIQETYLANSRRLDVETWARRRVIRQYADRAIALLSPLL